MSVYAKLEAANRRFSPRKRLRLGSVSTSLKEGVLIHDISSTGLLLEAKAGLKAFDRLEVQLREVGSREAVVVWTSGRYFGCQFAEPIPKAAVSAAMLLSPIADAPSAPLSLPSKEDEESADQDDRSGDLSFATKMRVILGASIALWALILWAAGIL
jgi:hypothetical protein